MCWGICINVNMSMSGVRDSLDTELGPVGFLGTKSFLCPHFFDYRKQASVSLHDLP